MNMTILQLVITLNIRHNVYIRGFIVIGCESEKFLCSFFKLTKCCASLMTHLLFWKTKRAKTFRIQN